MMHYKELIAATSAIVLIAFAIAIMPFQLVHDFDPKRPQQFLFPRVEPMQAKANPVAVANSGKFITAAAAEAGLTPGQFIATTVGMVTVASGYDITKGVGVNMAQTAGDAVANIVDAADYPSYDSLSETEKQEWGTQENYESSKYNSLLNTFGMGEDTANFFGSGGGNLDDPGDYDGWSEAGKTTLQKIGDIGRRWLNGSRVKFGEILDSLLYPDQVAEWIGSSSESYSYDLQEASFWDNSYPTSVYVNYGTDYQYLNNSGRKYASFSANQPVNIVVGNLSNGMLSIKAFSKNSFKYGYGANATSSNNTFTSTEYSVDGDTFYIGGYNITSRPNASTYGNMVTDDVAVTFLQTSTLAKINNVYHEILFGSNAASDAEKIEGYPETPIDDDQKVYFPDTGITPGITYNYFVTPTRSNNIYNPDNQTGSDEWKADTEDNVLPLLNIQFDKLFPFCMLFDIQKLFDKVTSVTGSGSIQESYMTVSIPLDVPGFSEGESLDLNLQWLHDLLVTVRPFVQILLGAGLLFVTIRFWQGVLTG